MKVGKLPENVWKRSVVKEIKNSGDNLKNNQYSLEHNSDSDFIIGKEKVIPFCKYMGSIAMYDAYNEIAPFCENVKSIGVNLYLDGRTGEEFVQHVAKDIDNIAGHLNVKIDEFNVHVMRGLKSSFITARAFGTGRKIYKKEKKEYDIVVTGYIAMAGTVIMSELKKDELLQRFKESYIDKAKDFLGLLDVQEQVKYIGQGVSFVQNLSEGGIYEGLWNLSNLLRTGITVDIKKIPIKQETIELSNCIDINPYELYSVGSLILATQDGESFVDKLAMQGINAVVIGRTTNTNDKLIVNEDEQRYITVPHQDSIYDIL